MGVEEEQVVDTAEDIEALATEMGGEDEVIEDVDQGSEEDVELSDTEKEAMAAGWNPEGVPGKPNLTAEEFLGRQPLYDELHKLKRQIKNQEKAFEALKKNDEMIRERMHEDHITELKKAKREAMENMDYDRVSQLDDEIYDAKDKFKEEIRNTYEPSQDDVTEVYQGWLKENPWYSSNTRLKEEADRSSKLYMVDNPNASLDDMFNYVVDDVKRRFPEEFSNKSRGTPATVEGSASGSRRKGANAKKTVADLPQEAREVMRTLLRSKTFESEQEFVDQFFK